MCTNNFGGSRCYRAISSHSFCRCEQLTHAAAHSPWHTEEPLPVAAAHPRHLNNSPFMPAPARAAKGTVPGSHSLKQPCPWIAGPPP